MPASLLMDVFDNLQRTLSMSVPLISQKSCSKLFLGKTPVIIESKLFLGFRFMFYIQ